MQNLDIADRVLVLHLQLRIAAENLAENFSGIGHPWRAHPPKTFHPWNFPGIGHPWRARMTCLVVFFVLVHCLCFAAPPEVKLYSSALQKKFAGDLVGAIADLQEAVTASRESSSSNKGVIHLALAEILEEANRPEAAIKAWQELIDLKDPMYFSVGFYGLAKSNMKTGNEEKARENCRELATNFPDAAMVKYAEFMAKNYPGSIDAQLAKILDESKKPIVEKSPEPELREVKSERTVKESVVPEIKSPETPATTTTILVATSTPPPPRKAEETEKPVPETVKGAKTPPGDDPMVLGNAAAVRRDWKTAAGFYQQAVEAKPKSYEARFNLARAFSFSGLHEKAIRVYSALLADSPGDSDALLGRGRVFGWTERYSEAEADLLAVTAGSPTYADAWSALGDLYKWNDHPAKAVAAYGQWILLKPADPNAFLARGKALRNAKDFKAARADFETARNLGGESKEIDQLFSSLLPRKSNPDAEIPEGFLWSAGLSYNKTTFTPDRDPWIEVTSAIRRRFKYGSLAIEFLRVSRFTQWDDAYALDAYINLWKGAYGNFRYQKSPDANLYPKTAFRGEIFQGFGKGWEFSVSKDRLNFSSTTNMNGLGLGKYIGNWYFRWKTLLIPGDGWVNYSNSLLARNYFAGTADNYWGISLGHSHGNKYAYGTNVVATNGSSAGATFQKYFSPSMGLKIAAGVSRERGSFTERDFTLGLTRRW